MIRSGAVLPVEGFGVGGGRPYAGRGGPGSLAAARVPPGGPAAGVPRRDARSREAACKITPLRAPGTSLDRPGAGRGPPAREPQTRSQGRDNVLPCPRWPACPLAN